MGVDIIQIFPLTTRFDIKDREFTGKVLEIVNGDALMVKVGKVVRKIHLASIRLDTKRFSVIQGLKILKSSFLCKVFWCF